MKNGIILIALDDKRNDNGVTKIADNINVK